jgi:hypothetical protein
MHVRRLKQTACGLVIATILAAATLGLAASPVSAASSCAGGGVGAQHSSWFPALGQSFGKDFNVTKGGSDWPGVSGACSPNGAPEKERATA